MTWLGLFKSWLLSYQSINKNTPTLIRWVDLRWQKESVVLGLPIPLIATVCHQLTCQRRDNQGIYIQLNKYVTLFKTPELSHCVFTKESVWSRRTPGCKFVLLLPLPTSNILKFTNYTAKFKKFYSEPPHINHRDSTINSLLYLLYNVYLCH